MKSVENGNRTGFDKINNLWFPHPSIEGGNTTIAYGHKIKDGECFDYGITEHRAVELLISDLELAESRALNEIDEIYGVGTFNSLPDHSKEILIDFTFNLGSLKSFPKFTKGVIDQEYHTMHREYKRYALGRELTGRNKSFFNRYLIH